MTTLNNVISIKVNGSIVGSFGFGNNSYIKLLESIAIEN